MYQFISAHRKNDKRTSEKRGEKMKNKIFLMCSIIFFISFICASPINDSIHLNVQAVDESGSIVTGTFKFEFNISTLNDCTNPIYTNYSTQTTDSRGIISYYLENTNLNYSDQYWLCVYRNGVLQSNEKIARTPYAFRARNVTISGIEADSNLDIINYNITTTGTGFFSWLGSLVTRITTLFVQDIDFIGKINGSGAINTTGNITADTFFGNWNGITNYYTKTEVDNNLTILNNSVLHVGEENRTRLHCSNITGTVSDLCTVTGGGDFSFTDFHNSFVLNSSILNNTKNIQELLNSTGIYNQGSGNTTFNQSLTDSLYSGIQWNYNQSTPAINHANAVNTSVINLYTINSTLNVQNLLGNSTIARVGNCSAGQIVQNITQNGVQCITDVSSGSGLGVNSTQMTNATIISINQTWLESLFVKITDLPSLVVSLVGNWTLDKINYNTTAELKTLFTNQTYVDSKTSNATWNQSLADTLYAGIIWNYNQTTPVFSYITDNEAAWLSTYNATYAANMANNSFNQTLGNLLYAPNTTIGIQWLINSTGIYTYNYNHTSTVFNLWNSTWDNRGLINMLSANDTSINTTKNIQELLNFTGIYSQGGGNGTFNQSLTDILYSGIIWNYNQTTPAINHANAVNTSVINLYTINTTLNVQNLLGNSTIARVGNCSAGQIVQNITQNGVQCITDQTGVGGGGNPFDQVLNTTNNANFTNLVVSTLNSASCDVKSSTNGTVYCGTDATGTGGSTSITNRTLVNYVTTNNMYNQTVITIPISANYNYSVYCALHVRGAAAATGVKLNISIPVNRKYWIISFAGATTATASLHNVTVNKSEAILNSTAGLVGGLPVRVDGIIENGASAGNFEVRMASEVINSAATVFRGSYCKLDPVA